MHPNLTLEPAGTAAPGGRGAGEVNTVGRATPAQGTVFERGIWLVNADLQAGAG